MTGGPGDERERRQPYDDEPERRAELRHVSAGSVQIVVARYAGYCYGVERALRITEEALDGADGPVASLGPIIHNPSVVGRLEERGVKVVEDAGEAAGGTLIVRTHGVPPEVVEGARARDLTLVDATCPFVAVAQRKAASLREAGYAVVILGERDHPEVVGLGGLRRRGRRGRRGRRRSAARAAARQARRRRGADHPDARQPGQRRGGAGAGGRELLVFNTICDATEKRQSAACELAAEVDVVVVVGGRNSANTARLAQLCRALESRTYHIESAAELEPSLVCRRLYESV